jgi:DNA invertase Pin-like site-specific DNA recombinase
VPLRLLGYIRRSQDSGTGVSEEIQRAKIEQWAALYEHQIEWLPPDLDASSWTLERPGLQKALEALAGPR